MPRETTNYLTTMRKHELLRIDIEAGLEEYFTKREQEAERAAIIKRKWDYQRMKGKASDAQLAEFEYWKF